MGNNSSLARRVAAALFDRSFLPSRIRSIGVTAAIVVSFVVGSPTPVQAAALWAQANRLQSGVGHSHLSADQPAVDPAYQPPRPTNGRSYVAPTPADKTKANGGLGPEKVNLRTRTSRTFATGGRSFTTVFFCPVVTYPDPAVYWQVG